MTAELKTLTIVALLTGLMWIPYILNLIMVRGLGNAVGYPENPAPLAPWAQRLKAAHANAIENLVVFAAPAFGGTESAGIITPAVGTGVIWRGLSMQDLPGARREGEGPSAGRRGDTHGGTLFLV